MPDFPLDPDLAAVSAALGALTPAASALNRDKLLFEAGRRSMRRPWASPVLTGVFAVLAGGLGVRLLTASPQVQVVYVDGASRGRQPPEFANLKTSNTPVAERPSFAGDPAGSPAVALQVWPPAAVYLQMRDQVVRFGADSLPVAVSAPSGPPPPVEQILGLPSGSLSKPEKSRWEHQLFEGGV